jgi:hypothetical protein
MMGTALGGYLYGFIEKEWGEKIPRLPLVGRSGAIAVACYFLAPKHAIVRDVGIAAAAIAGYTFGKTGTVSGDFDDLEQ